MASSSILTSLLQSWPSSRFSFRINSANFSIAGSSNPLLGLLETKLADQLELLKLQDDHEVGSSYLSARWLDRAMAVVLSTNSSIKAFVPDLQQALSEQGNLCKWLDESLDDSIRLLDACQILQETVTAITAQHSFAKLVLELMSLDKPSTEATLRRAKHALSKYGNLSRKRNLDLSPKRSKLETCGSMLRTVGEKLHSIDDALKGNALGAMHAAQITTILICGVLTTALSINHRRSIISTISVAPQSNWSLALSSLQQRVKEQVEKKKSKNQRMPYLEELQNVDSSLLTLEELINQALQAHQFPMAMEIEEPIKHNIVNLRRFSDDLGDGLAHLEQHISELYQVLITSRMMLLGIYPKSSSIQR